MRQALDGRSVCCCGVPGTAYPGLQPQKTSLSFIQRGKRQLSSSHMQPALKAVGRAEDNAGIHCLMCLFPSQTISGWNEQLCEVCISVVASVLNLNAPQFALV